MSKEGATLANRAGLLTLLAAVALFYPSESPGAQGTDALEARRAESQAEVDRIAREITLSDARMAALAAEIAAIRKDSVSLTAALIQAAKTEKKLAQDIASIETRLSMLRANEDTIRLSLVSRRGVLAEVLGALQRMGLNPPPAILVRPEDALSSVRSAILLGAVVPELRSETEVLLSELKELSTVRAAIDAERSRLVTTVAEQVAEKKRLNLLLEEKQQLQVSSEAALAAEREKAAQLAGKAGSLKELIASLESEIESVRKAVEEARRAEEERRRREAENAKRVIPESHRLAESAPFSSLRGAVVLPAAGHLTSRFGGPDGIGGTLQGDTLTTQSGAIVTAPAEGTVLYAGPFRSYGQLLILNAGDGYHIVLAGMGRITVALGQSVLAGEPVGAMGETKVASSAGFDNADAQPELYIEFRKDGKPVDPAPWWAERNSGRTGNDT
jgi:septal ring factor EnvC (AmiA/AmiB activator)